MLTRPAARLIPLLILALLTVAAPAQGAVSLKQIGTFDQPVHVAAAPGDSQRLYVVEQAGRIQVLNGGRKSLFADLTGVVQAGGERGLLSVAFAPNFQASRLLYVYYTNNAGNIEVDELRATSPDVIDAGYRRESIQIAHPNFPNHNGGQLQFGPGGLLYMGTGDGGSGGDPNDNAQHTDRLLGKLLRIAPRPGGGHSSPAGNPFGNEVWSYGLRNPFRFSFDRATGDLTIGDVGQDTTEEVDFVPASAGAGRGVNFGWRVCEGSFIQGSKAAPCNLGRLPVINHFRDPEGWRAIIGGYVVRDPTLPSLFGRYVYGDDSVGQVWTAKLAAGGASGDHKLFDLSLLSSFGQDNGGCIYATSLEGPVYRLVESNTRVPCIATSSGGGSGDLKPPKLKVRVPKRQRVRHNHGAIGYARCSERCRVSMSARLVIGRHSYKLKHTSKSVRAHKRLKLRTKLTKRASRAAKRALRRHKRVRVRVAFRARDGSGNRTKLVKRKLRVRR